MERWLVEESARLGLADKVIFAGFLRGEQLNRLYRMADIYVMPSVSEPFGITSLEALANGAPILISRQSGVAEMVSHCLKVDFWDVDQIAGKILAATRYAELRQTLQENGANEVKKFSWVESAKLCLGVYRQALTA
jgi:glycosyltransferase involved in cell wall biosynthesis